MTPSQGNEGRNYGNYNHEIHYVRDGNYNRDNNFKRGNYGNRNDSNRPYVAAQNRDVTPRDGGDSLARVEDMLHKMIRRFDANDEHLKELSSDLAGIGKKFDTHTISIKQIELQMAQLSTTMNTRQPVTFSTNIMKNPKNDAHCMEITIRCGK